MLRENQLGTRNMISAVTDEFWSMVQESVYEQALLFKSNSTFKHVLRENYIMIIPY